MGNKKSSAKKKRSAPKQPNPAAKKDNDVTLEKGTEAANESKAAEKSADKPAKSEKRSSGKPAAKKPNPVIKYFRDLKSEFKKVVWPSRKSVINNTGAVLAAMAVSGIAIFGLDSAFAALLQKLLSMAH